MLLDDVRSLFLNRPSHIEFLKKYAPISDSVMFQDIDFIHEICDYLRNQIVKHSSSCPVYRLYDKVEKKDLLDKCLWYDKDIPSFKNQTSGSTGARFEYLIWSDIYNSIEGNSHYGAIAKEFGIIGKAKILYMHQDIVRPNSTRLIEITKSNNPLISYGLYEEAEIHNVIVNKTYFNNYYKYYSEILEYAALNNIDIIHTKSNVISSMAWNIKLLSFNKQICKLLSNTGSKLNINDIKDLRNNIENWCDNMRCWDGGATFYTCRYNTYHLMDSLSWAYSDNHKLRTYDYFSIPSPFVNYWNGDYAEIGDSYQRCDCGRAYRHFKIGRTRSETSAIVSDSSLIKSQIAESGLLAKIKRIEVIDTFMRIFTTYLLDKEDKEIIAKMFPTAIVNFVVEENI
jgi:hypothetical protein